MPFFFSERIPVPHLKSYLCLSSVIFIASLVYGKDCTYRKLLDGTNISYSEAFLAEPFCLWALVNMAYCGLFLCGKVIQNIVLGQMRHVEQQHLQDKFWNYIFYKLIFIFGVINAQSLNEVLCWSAWFSMLGFLTIFWQLCKDRYEFVTASPTTPMHKHVKLISLISSIFLSSIALSLFAVYYVYPEAGMNILTFMIAECLLLGLKSLHILFRYSIQLCDLHQTGLWDRKAKVVYYTDTTMDVAILSLDLAYHFHMLIWSNVFISMASLVLYWNIRTIFTEIKKKIKKHRNYKKILKSVDSRFSMATEDELEKFADHCAICWDSMETARKLPCSHLFHHACLCSWLQQDVSCPTCRQSLAMDIGIARINEGAQANEEAQELQEMNENRRNDNFGGLRNYFFYLDGQQIANWFPSFSIEVFHGRADNTEQHLNDMGEQLFGLFPHISRDAILEDLRQTNSVDATADNILEGNLPTVEAEEAPALTANEDSHQDSSESVSERDVSTDSTTEFQSETESVIEDSSGTDEQVFGAPENGSDFPSRVVRTGKLNHNEARRRYLSKAASNQGDVSLVEQPPPSPLPRTAKNEQEERRTLLLESVERRIADSSSSPT